ncbi:MAG TPA: hypothetical protein VME69_00285 [Methylocella sp.]|nr:hypothetical protein [Methylocella sp.]
MGHPVAIVSDFNGVWSELNDTAYGVGVICILYEFGQGDIWLANEALAQFTKQLRVDREIDI